MRMVLTALACLAGMACTEATTPQTAAEGYTLEVRASDAEQIFMVTAPDGRVVAGRAAEGVSALMEAPAIQALAPPAETELNEVMALNVPGFGMRISGDEGEAGGGEDAARISINAGGSNIEIDAQEGGDDGEDRAFVRITGADEAAARDFITEADELSPAVQAQMLTGLGLD